MNTTAGCFLKKHENPGLLLFEPLLRPGNLTRTIVVLLSILLLCHPKRILEPEYLVNVSYLVLKLYGNTDTVSSSG